MERCGEDDRRDPADEEAAHARIESGEDLIAGQGSFDLSAILINLIGYVLCCIVVIPIGSVVFWVGSAALNGIKDGRWNAFDLKILIFEVLTSWLFAVSSFGFYPTDMIGHRVNLWPFILTGGALLFLLLRAIFTRRLQEH